MKVVVFQEAAANAPRGARFAGALGFARHCALPCVAWPRPLPDIALLVAHDRVVAERAAGAGVPTLLLVGTGTDLVGLADGVHLVRAPSAFVSELLLADLVRAASSLAPTALAAPNRPAIALSGRHCAEIAHGGVRARRDSVGIDLFKCEPQDWIGDPRDLWFCERDGFDAVVLHQVFVRAEDRAAATAEALRITRPGGTLTVVEPGAPPARIAKPETREAREPEPAVELSVLLVADHSGDARSDARALLATVRSARESLRAVPHEVLVLVRGPFPGAERAELAALVDSGAVRVRSDARPWTWPRRLELLRSAARGKALLVLAPGTRAEGQAFAELHRAADASGAEVVVPEAPHGELHHVLASCAWIAGRAWPPGLGDASAHQTPLFLTTLGNVRSVATSGIDAPGLAGKPLAATRLGPWRFDTTLPRTAGPVRRILLGCLRSLGDCVLATAPLAGLRARHPEAEITVLTEAEYAPVFAHDPAVDHVLAAPRGATEHFFWHEDAILCAALAEHGPFDRLAFLSDRLDNLSYVNAGLPMHAFYCVQAGVPEAADFAPTLALPQSARIAARARLAAEGIVGEYAVVHPRAGWPEKNPPEALFAAIVAEIRDHCGLPVVLVGGPGEFEHPRAVSLAGRQDLLESFAVIAGAKFHVGPDSGSLHAASALDVPSLGLYAGTGHRVSPLFARASIAVQSPASCRLPCGTSPCREVAPCAPALTIEHLRPHLRALATGEATSSEWIGTRPARWIASPAGATWALDEAHLREALPRPQVPHREVVPRPLPVRITRLSCDLSPSGLVAHQRAYLAVRERLIPRAVDGRYPVPAKESNPWQRPSARSATS